MARARAAVAPSRTRAWSAWWRRLDVPGHDACVLRRTARGFELEGCAVFLHRRVAAQLRYVVRCDERWTCVSARVVGRIGARRFERHIERDRGGAWTLDGRRARGLAACLDVDLGFTPATNWLALRRLALRVGEAAPAPAAWLDVGASALKRLEQRYARLSEARYAYESPTTGYAGTLTVARDGAITRYPRLWRAEATAVGSRARRRARPGAARARAP